METLRDMADVKSKELLVECVVRLRGVDCSAYVQTDVTFVLSRLSSLSLSAAVLVL